jgi:hypothetical protein
MRTTIAIATFLAVGAGVVGVGAATLKLRGSDTLKALSVHLLNTGSLDCGGVGNVPVGELDYDGTGSGNGQSVMQTPSTGHQYIAPMSRAMNSGICPAATSTTPGKDLTKSEGIVFELDGMSIVASGASVSNSAACNGPQDLTCTQALSGLAFSPSGNPKTVAPIGQGCDSTNVCPGGLTCQNPNFPAAIAAGSFQGVCVRTCTAATDCNVGGVAGETCTSQTYTDIAGASHTENVCGYTFGPSWKDSLRILFFGMSEQLATTANANRNCVSPERQYLADHYYGMFQSACTGNCTRIQHLFRRNDESGTSDVFVASLGVPSIAQQNNQSSFCNVGTQYPTEDHISKAAGCSADTDCKTPRPASMGTYSDGTAIPFCAATNGTPTTATFKRCDYAMPCAADTDCGATVSPCPGGTTDTTMCAPVPAKACSPVNDGLDPNGTTKINRCIFTRLNMACNTDSDCGNTRNFQTATATPIAGSCATDATSPTGKSCIRGATAQMPVSDNDAFLPKPADGSAKPRNTPITIAEGPDVTTAPVVAPLYRGEYFVDMQDRDAIRRVCAFAGTAQEQVCSIRGDLGLLLPIWDVPQEEIPAGDAYPVTACSNGKFDCAPATRVDTHNASASAVYALCPDGENPNLAGGATFCGKGKCPAPVLTTLDRKCIAPRSFVPGLTGDGRVFNLTTWTGPTGSQIKAAVTRATGILNSTAIGTTASAAMVGAFYRIHTTNSFVAGKTCQLLSSTAQIGCLVQGSPCSSGYAGNSAVDGTNTIAIKVNGIDAVDPCIRLLVVPAAGTTKYPLSRKLYLNAIDGFESLVAGGTHAADPNVGDQKKMADCFANGAASTFATSPLGFTSLPASLQQSFCEDLNESTLCGTALYPTNTDACTNNTGHVPTCEIDATGATFPAGCTLGAP